MKEIRNYELNKQRINTLKRKAYRVYKQYSEQIDKLSTNLEIQLVKRFNEIVKNSNIKSFSFKVEFDKDFIDIEHFKINNESFDNYWLKANKNDRNVLTQLHEFLTNIEIKYFYIITNNERIVNFDLVFNINNQFFKEIYD